MSAPFNPYAPRDQSIVDVVAYARRAIDEMSRSNPLQNAVVSSGLIRWLGNYTNSGNPDKINFLWIGGFFPADPNMGGAAQRGLSLVRDDARGGISALAMYDPSPNFAGTGLRQVLIMTSGDGRRLMEESRDGGQRWPQENIWVGGIGSNAQVWVGTTASAFGTVHEGRANIIGNRIFYRVFCYNDVGVASEHRLRVSLPGGDVVGTTHVLGVGLQDVFESSVDVSAGRGQTCEVRWETRRTAGVDPNLARSAVVSLRCYTP